MIRAAALSYAIVFSLLTGLICSGVLFIASTQKKIQVIHNNRERVLFDSYAAVRYGVLNVLPNDSAVYIHQNGDTSRVAKKRWGAFTLVVAETRKNSLEKRRAALTGTSGKYLPALYLPGNASGLKITGRTRIEGTAFVPNASVERAYIGGKNYEFDKLVFGEVKTAGTQLPVLRREWSDISALSFTQGTRKLEKLPQDSVFAFHEKPSCYESLYPVVLAGALSGNVIIHSFDSIYIDPKAKLENVLLIAPVVHFGEGFSGSAQVVAHERIVLERNVHLLYPSVLVLNELAINNPLTKRTIVLDENSMVLGGILMTTQQYDFRKLPFLEIRHHATVAGLVYNTGETELFGNIAGSLYTGQLLARVGGGSYGNHLADAVISRKELPADFLLPVWLEEQVSDKQKIIKWL